VRTNLTPLLAHLLTGLFAFCPGYAVPQKQVLYVQVVEKATPAVILASSATLVPTGTSVTFTVKVTGTATTPSGLVVFLDSASKLGTGSLDSTGVATWSTGTLAVGVHQITASYGGDANYTPGTTSPLLQSVVGVVTPMVTVTLSSESVTTADVLTVTINVNGRSGYPPPTGLLTLVCGSYNSGPVALSNGTAVLVVPAGALALGSDVLTVSYLPDSGSSIIYNPASNTASVTVRAATGTAVTPGFTILGTAVTVVAGATTGNSSTITITPIGGFTGPVSLSAVITAMPVNVVHMPSFSFGSTSPVVITSSSSGQATLTFFTRRAIKSSQLDPSNVAGRWWPVGGAALACILLFGIPARRRRWQSILGLLLLLPILAAGASACGADNWFATKGTYTVTVTGVSIAAVARGTVILTIQ
jgi:hypothetical protein